MGILPDGIGSRMPVDKPPATESPAQGLSENDRFLIQKTEDSIRDGLQLERWWREHENKVSLFPLDLKKKYQLQNHAEGFFSELSINGASRTVMGCRQTVEFGKITGPRAPDRLREFVLAEFLKLNERAVLPDRGAVSKEDADRHAAAEYEEFADRRRALIEAEAEREQRAALEAAAKGLPDRTKPKRRR